MITSFPSAPSSQTSRDAARQLSPAKAATQRDRIRQFVADRGDEGATRDQIVSSLALAVNAVCPRVLELIASGHLIESTETRQTRSGRKAFVLKHVAPFVSSPDRPEGWPLTRGEHNEW